MPVPRTAPLVFITGHVQFDWGAIGSPHQVWFDLVDEQEEPVLGQDGAAVTIRGDVNVAPHPNAPFGTPLGFPIVIPVTPQQMALEPGTRYEFRVTVDGQTHEDWNLGFVTMPEAQSQAA